MRFNWIRSWIGPAVVIALLVVAAFWIARGLIERTADPLARGRLAYDRGDWRQAAQVARERLIRESDDARAVRLLARAEARMGRDAETERLYTRLGAEGAEAEDFWLLGSALLRRGQEGPGLRMLERAKEIDPDHAENLQSLVREYRRLNFPLAAADASRRLAAISGWEIKGRWLLGLLLMDLDRPVLAADQLKSLLGKDPDGLILGLAPGTLEKSLARAWLRVGNPVEARTVLESFASHGTDEEASWLLSRASLQEGDLPKAKQALARAGNFGDIDPTLPEPAVYVGSAACANCHAAIHRAQQSSHHARTFAGGTRLQDLPLPAETIPEPGDPRLGYHFARTEGNQIRLESRAEDRIVEAIVAYAIGSGNRGRTPVVRDAEGLTRECRLTHYAGSVGWDLTIHHPARPESLPDSLGKPLIEDQVRDCINCHATNPDAVLERRPGWDDVRGIGCERCHGPGGNHLRAVELGFPDLAIARPGEASGPQRDALCAQCHRAPKGIPDNLPDFIRFQSPNLARSRCSIESEGSLDCTSCHDPHHNANPDPNYYEAICLGCHRGPGTKSPSPGKTSGRAGKACPVNPDTGCLKCHMPGVPDVIPHTSYTDHFIRVRRD